ncbi:MAG: hypothetical protein ACRCUA_06640, partial [Fusobacteriaceae bacterium]
LKTDVKKSLSLYIQGVVKKMKEVEIEVIKKVVEKKPIIHKEEIGSPISYPDKQNEEIRNILFSLFENFDKEKQLDLEEKARKEYLSEVNQNEMNDFLEKSYKFSRKKFIVDEIIKLK